MHFQTLHTLSAFPLLKFLLATGDNGTEVSGSACLDTLFLCFFQLFAVNIPALCKCSDTRGLVLTKNTVIRALSDRNIIHRAGLSVFIALTDKSLDFPFSFPMSLFFPAFDFLDLTAFSTSCWSSVGISASVCQCHLISVQYDCGSLTNLKTCYAASYKYMKLLRTLQVELVYMLMLYNSKFSLNLSCFCTSFLQLIHEDSPLEFSY